MISLSHWLLFFSVTFAVSASPGPLMLLTMSNGMHYGYFRSLPGMLGASLGNLILVGVTALGIGLLVHSSEEKLTALKWFGVLYLIYLGGKQFFSLHRYALSIQTDIQTSGLQILFKAFLVSLTNPKGIIYFVALFPQFIVLQKPLALQFMILTLTFLVTDLIWMSIYAKGGNILAMWLKSAGHQYYIRCLSGGLLIVAALILAFSQ
ncbi:MAG: LysE family translocator [Gammaproteobacteria bacterium]|nr:LysE family translocator [Gammaproteobacteria bacterium]